MLRYGRLRPDTDEPPRPLGLNQPCAVGEDHEARIQSQEHRQPVDEVPLLCFVPRGIHAYEAADGAVCKAESQKVCFGRALSGVVAV